MRLRETLVADAFQLARTVSGRESPSARMAARVALRHDGYKVLVLTRLREGARRWHIPLANHLLRLLTTIVYGIEIENRVQLGAGINFAHTVGTVIGGTSQIGARVQFMGNNTVGTAKGDGYPVIEEDVFVGVGARVLGPICVGRGAVIGANAVVVHDVRPGAVVVGIPATEAPAKTNGEG
jgi:serine O-acetyltransferase